MVGVVLMIVGVIGLIAELAFWDPRRRATTVVREQHVVPDPYDDPYHAPRY